MAAVVVGVVMVQDDGQGGDRGLERGLLLGEAVVSVLCCDVVVSSGG